MIYKTSTALSKVYHYAVGLVRKKSGSTSMGFLKAIAETMFSFLMMMMIMMMLRGLGVKLRGDFGFYILSGIAPFLLHNKIFQTLLAQTRTDPMLPVLAISQGMMIVGSILHEIYMQIVVFTIFYLACVIYYGHSAVDNWTLFLLAYLVGIIWSIALGVFFLSITPLAPPLIKKIAMIYRRLGIVTSGKMIPGNLMALTGRFHGLFLINPLYHVIDQFRGAMFLHYVPNSSNLMFPVKMSIAFFCIASIIYFALKRK